MPRTFISISSSGGSNGLSIGYIPELSVDVGNKALKLIKGAPTALTTPGLSIDEHTSFGAIGTSTNGSNLLIAREGAAVNYRALICSDTAGASGGTDTRRSRGTFLNPTALQSGDVISTMIGRGYDGVGSWVSSCILESLVDAAVSVSSVPQAFRVRTGSNGVTTRFRISSSGTVGIGMGDTTPLATLQVTGGVAISSSSSAVTNPGLGNFSVSGNTTLGSSSLNTTILNGNCTVGTNSANTTTLNGNCTVGSNSANTTTLNGNCTVGSNSASTTTLNGNCTIGNNSTNIHNIRGQLNISALLSTTGTKSVISAKSANYTATINDEFLLINAATGARQITLPSAASANGSKITIIKTDASANLVTVTPVTSKGTLSTQYEAVSFISDGASWFAF